MSPAEMRQWALDAYNAGQISEQTLDQILDDIDAQEKLTGSGISLEAELNRLNQDPVAQHSISPIVGQQADYGIGVVLDTTFFDGVKPRDWGKVLGNYVHQNLAGTELKVYDDAGNEETIYIAKTTDRVTKDGAKNSHKVIDKLARYRGDNIKALATVHLSELLQTSTHENTTNDNNHQWLDQNGWEHRKTYIQDAKGNIYEAWLNIAKGRERNILYEINNVRLIDKANNKRAAHGAVPSTDTGRGSHIKSSSSEAIVTETSGNVNGQHSISGPAERQNIIRDLRSILDRGGDPNELRRYVTQLELGTQTADRVTSVSGQESTESQRILQAARDRGIGVEEYLEQNWERYDVDGQWNADAREALELEERGRGQHSIGQLSASSIYDYSKSFSDQIDDFKKGNIPQGDTLLLGATPNVYQSIGFNALPLTINTTHVDYALNGTKDADHHMGEAMLKQLPDRIKQPIAVFVSQTHGTTSVVALLNFTVNGKHAVVPIAIDGYGFQNNIRIDSNAVTSAYGKTSAISQLYKAAQDEANGKFALLYANKKEALSLLQRAGHQLSGRLIPHDGFYHSIRENNSPVKSRFNNVTETQQFKRWFGDWMKHPNKASKVVNADGTPEVVYHGSADMFDTFSYGHIGSASGVSVLGDGFYFTDQKNLAKNYGENVYECYLQMKTPCMANASDSYRLNTTQLKAQGYDGVILNTPNGNVYMVFDNTQIKSATDNIGTFDGNDPNIRHSISEAPGSEIEQDIADDFPVENEADDVRSVLPKKARDYLKRTERTLLNGISRNLGVPWFAQREYLKPLVEEISNEYVQYLLFIRLDFDNSKWYSIGQWRDVRAV